MDDHQAALMRELDGYIAFLRRRQELELDYADSLKRLSRSTSTENTNELHAQIPTTWRHSWGEVKNSVENEGQAHRMAAEGLDRLIQRLGHFRDDRDRIGRRIRDDLRSTASEYADYKAVVGRLRKSYERKVEELQHHEEAEHLKESHEKEGGTKSPGHSELGGWPPEHWHSNNESGQSNAAKGRNRSSSSASSSKGGGGNSEQAGFDDEHPSSYSYGSPPHSAVFVSGATSTSGAVPSAYRDPPTAKQNVFEAIAKRDWTTEKNRVNSIVRAVGSLAKGNDPSTALNPNKGVRSRQYGSKLKREAEEADRQYRAGIFQLETLRLQKQRVQASARESLREFVTELALSVKSTLDQRVADQLSLGYSQVAIGDHIKPAVDRIEPYGDVENYFLAVRDEAPPDPPVYYINAFIGECRSLLFGVGLQDYCANHAGVLVPLIVQRCIAKVETSGLDFEGIYRVPGKLATVQQLVHQFEKEEESFQFSENEDVSAVAGVLKLYLRQLPIPLFPFLTVDRKAFIAEYASSPESAIAALIRRIRRLSPPQQATLKALCHHLARVVEYEPVNKMTASNLGMIFSTVVFGEEEGTTLETLQHFKDSTMEVLIKQQSTLFDGLPLEQPPLVRSRNPSGNLNSFVRPPSAQSAQSAQSPQSVQSTHSGELSPSPSLSALNSPNLATRNSRQSVESIYALYQNAASSGLLVAEPHQAQLPPHPPSRASALPVHPNAPRPHVQHVASPLRSSSTSSEPPYFENLPPPPSDAFRSSRHDLNSPSPPLSAALGRHIPQSNSTSSL